MPDGFEKGGIMGRRKHSMNLWRQRNKERKFAPPRVMSEIKCSQTVANSQMKRARAAGKKIVREGGFICSAGRRCSCGGGGYSFTVK